jgi:putative ABC transport system permease protein
VIALTLQGLAARKLRSVLTAIAVLLGVAMIAGTYVLTDQIRGGFEDLEASVYSNVDVEVSPKTAFSSQFSMARPLDDRLLKKVSAVPGVAKTEGELWAPGGLVIDGKLKKASGGGGTIITTSSGEPFSPATNIEGHMPEASGEVALIRATADKYHLSPGDRIAIATHRGIVPVTVVGAYDVGTSDPGGTDVVSAPLEDIQAWFDREGQVSSINVAADDGVSPEALVRRIQEVVPKRVQVRTGEQAAEETASDINEQIGGFLTPSRSARASSPCCAPWARRAGRCWEPWHSRRS